MPETEASGVEIAEGEAEAVAAVEQGKAMGLSYEEIEEAIQASLN